MAPTWYRSSLIVLVLLAGCSDLLTSAPDDGETLDAPFDGLTSAELSAFARGDAEFARRFAPSTGLGPIFNDVSCAACHSADGRGRIENSLARIGTPLDEMLRSSGGPQIQTRAIPGAERETIPSGVPVSLRLPPPVFGAGLIEAISEADILAHADPQDADGDGISGRPNLVIVPLYVPPYEPGAGSAGGTRIGRFGRKAQTASLLQQTVEAYHQDMGITTPFLPDENRNPRSSLPLGASDVVPDPELGSATALAVVNYLRMLTPPSPGPLSTERERGQALFTDLACARCHVPAFIAGPHPVRGIAGREVRLYSDLLLHDMGDELADHRPDGDASGREWRTPPLWGLRLMNRFLNGDAFLLHDGRARTIEQAILLHGGEAAQSRQRFSALPDADRRALLSFVGSR